MLRIAVLDDYQHVGADFGDWASLPGSPEVVCFSDHVGSADELVARLRHFEIVVAMRERTAFPRTVLERLVDLRLLVTTGYRNAVIDVAAATELGITVCGTGGTNCLAPTPELTWALILACARNLPQEVASVRSGGWQQTIGRDLAGATLGVIGLGHMGGYVAKIGKAFDMRVIAWSHNLTAERCAEVGVELVSSEVLYAESDVITVHLQLSARTQGLIGRKELQKMRPTAILVNTSRGPIVVEDDLVDALSNRIIAGAAIDVFDVEPLPRDHPYRSVPNLIPTPHIGYVTHACYRTFIGEAVEDIAAYLKGNSIRLITADGPQFAGLGAPK